MTDLSPVLRLRPDERELLGQAAEILPEPIFVVEVTAGERLRMAAANRAAMGLLGVETIVDRFLDQLPEARRPDSLVAEIARCLRSGAAVSCERVVEDPRGERIFRFTLTPTRSATGRLFRVTAVGRDVTDERAAEKRLHLLEFALDEIRQVVYLVDEQGRIRFASAEAMRSLGYSPVELVGLTISRLTPDWPAERWPNVWQETREHGHLAFTGIQHRKDGTTFPVEVKASHIEFHGQEYLAAIVQDVTERRRVEAELHARAEEFRALVENSPDVVIRYDRECRRTYANPALLRLAGAVTPEEMLGKSPTENAPLLSHPPEYEWKIRQTFATGEPQALLFHGDGSRGPFWAQARFVPEHDPEGRITSVLAIGHDVTELIDAQQHLRRRNRELRALSRCSQAVIRAEDEHTLLTEACRILCEDAGYLFAWIGYAEQDVAKSVRPVAWAGCQDEYLNDTHDIWCGEIATGQGPAGRAIRTIQPVVVQEIASDPCVLPWRDSLRARGYRSLIALPLKQDGEAFGALTMYASEPDAITREEIRLLEELAQDVAFGVVAQRRQRRLRQADAGSRGETEVGPGNPATLGPGSEEPIP